MPSFYEVIQSCTVSENLRTWAIDNNLADDPVVQSRLADLMNLETLQASQDDFLAQAVDQVENAAHQELDDQQDELLVQAAMEAERDQEPSRDMDDGDDDLLMQVAEEAENVDRIEGHG